MGGRARGKGQGQSQGAGGSGGRERGPGDWDCPCGFKGNFARNGECYRCKQPKPGSSSGGGRGSGTSSQSSFQGGSRSQQGGATGGRERRPGDWDCPCGMKGNFASKGECHKCGAPKSSAGSSSSGGPSQFKAGPSSSGGGGQFRPKPRPISKPQANSTINMSKELQELKCPQDVKEEINSPAGQALYLGWDKSFYISDEQNDKLNKDKKINQLPGRKMNPPGVPINSNETIEIIVNHIQVDIKLPPKIYQYRVDIERVKKPKKDDGGTSKKGGKKPGADEDGQLPRMLPTALRKTILNQLIPRLRRKLGADHGLITDFSAAIYSLKIFKDRDVPVEGKEMVKENLLGPEEAGETFLVKIKKTEEEIDTTNLGCDLNNMNTEDLKVVGVWASVQPRLVVLEKVYSTLIRCIRMNKYTPMRRADLINFEKAGGHFLGGGVVSYPGYNVTLPIVNGWKKFINVEIANLAVYMGGPVSDVIKDVLGYKDANDIYKPRKEWSNSDKDKVDRFLKTCKIRYEPKAGIVRSKVVVGLCWESVSEEKFEIDKNGRTIETTVFDYFRNTYGTSLKYRNGPCLELKGGGDTRDNPKVPAEICTMKDGQSYNRKLDDKQVRKIAEKSKLDPDVLKERQQGAYGELQMNKNELLQAWGVSVPNSNLHEIKNAHVISPPRLVYGKEHETNDDNNKLDDKLGVITPNDGTWDLYQTRFEFFSKEDIEKMGILNLSGCDKRQTEDFARRLSDTAAGRGLKIPPPCYVSLYDKVRDNLDSWKGNVDVIRKSLLEFKNKFVDAKGVFETRSFVLVFLPVKNSALYHHVKQAAELHVGLLTQCIVESNTGRGARNLDSIVGNLLLKINSKLSQTNYVVMPNPKFPKSFTVFDLPVMILGGDVTHPPPGSSIKQKINGKMEEVPTPSFAALTASIERSGMPYMMHIQAQVKAGKGAAEVIQNMDLVIRKFLDMYIEKTRGYTPVKIIYFRDGVGDSQFEDILQKEMTAIRRACTGLQKGYEPKITIITVQKRHKTRFFLKNSPQQNVEAGTVVDTDIVHPTQTDYFLVSHKGMMGTSRPTRYHLIWDDSDFTMDEIQTLSYYLCYMFVRCNKSVKIPAPTYYAHWACARADSLARGWGEGLYHNIDALNAELNKRETINNFSRNYPMHFC